MSLANMLLTAWPVLAPLICKQRYGGAPAYAALNVAWATGMLLGGSILLRFKPRYTLRVASLAFLPAVLPGIALGLHAPIAVAASLMLFSGIGLTIDNALWWTAMQQHVPKEAISRVSAYDWVGTLAIAPIGYALIGPLANGIGTSTAIIASSVAAFAVGATALLVPDIRNLRSRPPTNADDPAEGLATAN